jgi:hypothetical protein
MTTTGSIWMVFCLKSLDGFYLRTESVLIR